MTEDLRLVGKSFTLGSPKLYKVPQTGHFEGILGEFHRHRVTIDRCFFTCMRQSLRGNLSKSSTIECEQNIFSSV